MNTDTLRKRLAFWFTVHFAADVLIAVPLMVAPRAVLAALGWEVIDPVASRLVAAALFGIGIESLVGRRADFPVFRAMLNLKIIWSSAAILGFVLSLIEGTHGRPWSVWVFLAVFVAFNALWVFYSRRVADARHAA